LQPALLDHKLHCRLARSKRVHQYCFRFFSFFRKPGIVYNAFRIIVVIILSARAPQTRTLVSNFTTGGVAASLISQVTGWQRTFDLFSIVSMLGTMILFGLNIYQIVLGAQFTNNGNSPHAFGYGGIRLLGGNCPRWLHYKEDCEKLIISGCGEASSKVEGLLGHEGSLVEVYAGFVMCLCIGSLILYIFRALLTCESRSIDFTYLKALPG
jgi:hypothetical protein